MPQAQNLDDPSRFIRIVTPDGDAWSDQEHYVRADLIVALRLCRKLASPGSPENGVEFTVQSDRGAASNRYWIRCTSIGAARSLYDNIIEQMERGQ